MSKFLEVMENVTLFIVGSKSVETNQEETEASGKTSDSEPVEASAGTEQTDVSSEPEPDPSENKESKEEK